jgi:exoribonuclease R
MNKIFKGQIRTNTKGLGYLRNEEINGFIEIPKDKLNTALDLDLVKVEITGKNRDGEMEGQVLEVLKRDKNVWVGVIREVYKENGYGKEKTFIPDNKRFYPRTKIDNLESFPRLKENQKVLVELVKYES